MRTAILSTLALLVSITAVEAERLDANIPISIGDMSAPVTLTVFSGMTCVHCAKLAESIIPGGSAMDPEILEAIEDGRLRLDYRLVIWDKESLWAEMASRCTSDPKEAIRRIFATQNFWIQTGIRHPTKSTVSVPPGLKVGHFYKMLTPDLVTEQELALCVKDSDYLMEIVEDHKAHNEEAGVTSVPALIVDGKLVEGDQIIDEIKSAIAK